MSGEDIVVNLLGNDDLSPVIEEIVARMESLAATIDTVGTDAELLATSFSAVADAAGRFTAIVGGLDEITSVLDRLTGTMTEVDAALQDAVANAAATRDAFTVLAEASATTDDAMTALQEKLGGLITDFPSLDEQASALAQSLQRADVSGLGFASELDTLGATLATEAGLFQTTAQRAVDIATAFGDAGVSMDAIRARAAALAEITTTLNEDLGGGVTMLANWIDKGIALGLVTEENFTRFATLADTLRSALAGIDGLSGAMDRLNTRGTMTRATIAGLNAVLADVEAAAAEATSLGFDVLGNGITAASEKGQEALAGLRAQMDTVAGVAGDDQAAFLGLTGVIADGSNNIDRAGIAAANLTDTLRVMQSVVLADSDGLQTLGLAQADLAIRTAAANDQYAAANNILQTLAQKYVAAADEAAAFSRAMSVVQDKLAMGQQGVTDWVMAMQKAGVTFEGLGQISATEVAQIRADLQGIGDAASRYLGQQIEAASTLAEASLAALAAEADTVTASMMEHMFGSSSVGNIQAYKAALYQAEQETGAWARATQVADGMTTTYYTDLAAAESKLSGFGGAVASGADALGRQWMNLGLAAGALDMFGLHAITSGAEFQRQMTVNANLAANAQDNIQQMTDYLIQVGPSWGRTPLELSHGLYYIMSDGFHGAQALDILKEAAYASAGGLGKFSDMARGITILMNNFGKGLYDTRGNLIQTGISAEDAANIVINAVTAGSTSVEDFATNIGKIAPTAADAGYNIKTMATSFDVMTRAGISSANAGTYLRAVMMSIGDRAVAVAEKAQGYGVAIDGAHLSQLGMVQDGTGLLQQLHYIHDAVIKASYAHGTLAQQTAWAQNTWINLIGGIRSGQGALAMSAQDFANYTDVLAQWDYNAGKGQTALGHFTAMNSNLAFAISELKARLSGVAAQFVITYGSAIAQKIVALANELGKLTAMMQKNPKELGHALLLIFGLLNGAFLASLLAAGGGMLGMFRHSEQAAHGAERLARVLEGGRGSARNMAGALEAVGRGAKEAGKGARESESMFSPFFKLLGSGDGVFMRLSDHAILGGNGIVGALTRSRVAGEMFGVSTQTYLRGLGKVFKDTAEAGGPVEGTFAMLNQGAKSFFMLGLRPLGGLLNGVGNGMVGLGKTLFGLFDAFMHPVQMIQQFGSMLFSAIPAVIGLGSAILPVIAVALAIAGVIAIVVLAFTHFRKESEAALKPLVTVFTGVFKQIVGMVMMFVQNVQQTWNSLWPAIRPAMEQLLNAIKGMEPVWKVIGAVIKVVVGVILGVLQGLVSGFLHALPFIINFFTGLIHIITTVAQIIIAIFHGDFNKIPGLLGDLIGNIFSTLGSGIHAILTFVGNLVKGIFDWFAKLVKGGPLGAIIQFIQGIVQWFQHLFDVLVGHSIIPDLVRAIAQWFGKVVAIAEHIGQFVVRVVTFFVSLATQVLATVGRFVSTIVNLIVGLVTHIINAIVGFVSTVVGAWRLMVGTVVGAVTGFVATVIGLIVGFVTHIINAIMGFVATILGAFNKLRAEGIAGIGTFVATIIGAILGLVGNVLGAFGHLVGGVIGAIGHLVGSVLGAIGGFVGNFLGAIGGLISNVVSTFTSLPGQIVTALSSLGSQLWTVASNAMDSMVGAITGAAGRLGTAAKNVVGNIINSAKSALGIASPSRVFLEIGGHTVDGMAQGLLGNAHKVRSAALLAFGPNNLPVGSAGRIGGGAGMAWRAGVGGGGGGGVTVLNLTIHGSGFQLLDPTTRRRIALDIGKELSLATGLQGIQPLGYSGRGTI